MAGAQQSTNGGRTDFLHDEDYFMAVAFLAAKRSKDPSSQVGACIVNQDGKVVGIGYNCMPNGCEGQLPWARNGKDEVKKKYFYVCHAELNAIMNKFSADVKGCTIYVALFPCNECAKIIIQSGLKKVVFYSDKYEKDKTTIASKKMLEEAGITVEQFRSETTQIDIDFESINRPPPS